MRTRTPQAVAAAFLLFVLASCAVNPATGKRQLVLVSEGQETQMGRESDKSVLAQFGSYDDPALQDYVQRLGKNLAAKSERPDLDWSFRVVDDPLVNAFALPGGYIYITRGILAHFNSEAELASVLGHEIGHVTARHSVNQMSKAQLLQVGLGVGMAVSEGLSKFGDAAQAGLGLAFLKFGRDDERQADDLGVRYLVRGGYDPRPMADVFETLRRVSTAGGGDRPPGWLSTHPDPENRASRTRETIAAMDRNFNNNIVRRNEYLQHLEGVVYGDDPRHGYFEEQRFLQPEMQFQIDFPAGWKLRNQRQSVSGSSEAGDGVIQLTLSGEDTAAEALRKFMGQEGVARTGSREEDVNGLTAHTGSFTAMAQDTPVAGQVAFVEHRGQVFQVLGFTTQAKWDEYKPVVRATLGSFRRLTDQRALGVQPKRLHLVQPERNMSAATFTSTYKATLPAEEMALLNGVEPGEAFQAGRTYKVVRGGELP